MSYIRTFTTVQHINKAKEQYVRDIIPHYRHLSTTISNTQWQLFFTTSSFNKNDNSIITINSPLSQRYRQTALYQVVGILKSYIANKKNDFKTIVYNSSLSDETKKSLYFINKYGAWYRKEVLCRKEPIDEETVKLSRYIMRHIFKRNRKPSFKRANMALDDKVAQVVKDNGSSSFDYWITLSTLTKYKTIDLPLTTHKFFDNTVGEVKKFCQINLDKNNNIKINLIKECPQLSYTPLTDKISVDFGLRVLFASDNGDLLGRNLIDTLRYYDTELLKIVKYQQQLGLSVKTHRYNAIVQYIRDLLKQEICRAVNRLIAIHAPKEIVVEKLDFSDTSLSHQMNRILRNCGRRLATAKLDQINQELGIIITETNPAYSSQVCTNCGYVDKGNRPTQGEFKCKACHYTLNADVKSAREHKARSSCLDKGDNSYSIYKSKESILHTIIRQYFSRMEKQKGCYSSTRVMTLLCESEYYQGWCSRLDDRELMKEGSSVKAKGLRGKKKKQHRRSMDKCCKIIFS